MPNRLVRDGFLDSEAINALGDAAECFYHRLLLAADDAGRMDGRVDILRARLFPLSSRRASDVERQLSECMTHGLVMRYEWLGKPYLQLTKVQRCSPCTNSKFPWKDGSHKIVYVKRETRDGEKEFVVTSLSLPDGLPIPFDPPASECTESGTLTLTKSETKAKGGRAKRAPETPLPENFGLSERVRAWAAEKGHGRLVDRLEHFVSYAKRKGATYCDWDEALMTAIREDWAKLGGPSAPAAQVKPKHKCAKCGEPCHGRDWKGNLYCDKHWSEFYQADGDAKLAALRGVAA